MEESLETVEEILQANPDVVVIVDEAYVDFGGKSALPLLKKYENLLVVQTFPSPELWRECVSVSASATRN